MAPEIRSWTGGVPSVLHFQGKARLMFRELMMSYVTHTGIKLPGNVSIVTFCNGGAAYGSAVLLMQLGAAGVPYVNAANGVEGRWSNTLKPELLLKVIGDIETDYVLVLDSFDVVIQSFDNMLAEYAAIGKDVLFGATRNNFPCCVIDDVAGRGRRGNFRWLNSGTCLGPVKRVKEFYQAVVDLNISDNAFGSEQFMIRHAFNSRQGWVGFDWQCRVFQTFNNAALQESPAGDGLAVV